MMSKIIFLGLVLFTITSCFSGSVEDLKILGTDKFSTTIWLDASQEERGKMVYSFFKTNDIYSMTAQDIKKLLGKPTGYYNYDEFPAYMVGDKSVQSNYGSGYILAFPIDRDTELISRYVIIPTPK